MARQFLERRRAHGGRLRGTRPGRSRRAVGRIRREPPRAGEHRPRSRVSGRPLHERLPGQSIRLGRRLVPDLLHGVRRQGRERDGVLAVPRVGLRCAQFCRKAVVVLVHGPLHRPHDRLRHPGHEAMGFRSEGQVSDLALRLPSRVPVDLLLPGAGVSLPVGDRHEMGRRGARQRRVVHRPDLAFVRRGLRMAALLLHVLLRSAPGMDRLGRGAHVRPHPDLRDLQREALLLVDLRVRRPRRDRSVDRWPSILAPQGAGRRSAGNG